MTKTYPEIKQAEDFIKRLDFELNQLLYNMELLKIDEQKNSQKISSLEANEKSHEKDKRKLENYPRYSESKKREMLLYGISSLVIIGLFSIAEVLFANITNDAWWFILSKWVAIASSSTAFAFAGTQLANKFKEVKTIIEFYVKEDYKKTPEMRKKCLSILRKRLVSIATNLDNAYSEKDSIYIEKNDLQDLIKEKQSQIDSASHQLEVDTEARALIDFRIRQEIIDEYIVNCSGEGEPSATNNPKELKMTPRVVGHSLGIKGLGYVKS